MYGKNANLSELTPVTLNSAKNCSYSYRIVQYSSEIVVTLLFVVSKGSRFDSGTVHLDGFDATVIIEDHLP